MVKHGQHLKEKLDRNTDNFITESYFNKGDKLFLCSDGIGDNFSNSEIASFVYTFRNSRECLKNVVNGIYEIENQKLENRTNNPPPYLERNSNFRSTLKGNKDNISGVIIENKGEER